MADPDLPDQLWLAEFKKRATLCWRKLSLLFVCKNFDSCGKIREKSQKKNWKREKLEKLEIT